jgi:pimeloyl-ACP methyl ester carboxylesterase
MQHSIFACEPLAEVAGAMAADARAHPEIGSFSWVTPWLGNHVVSLYEQWLGNAVSQPTREPVVSDIPTLVLAGEYDQATPPAWGKLAAESLRNSFFCEFPGLTHNAVGGDACVLDIVLKFLDDPTAKPDDGCIAASGRPEFVLPD